MTENYTKQTKGELEKLLAEKRKTLRDSRFGATGGKNNNVKASRELRKEIARVLTSLSTK